MTKDKQISLTLHYLQILMTNNSYMQQEMRDAIKHAYTIVNKIDDILNNLNALNNAVNMVVNDE